MQAVWKAGADMRFWRSATLVGVLGRRRDSRLQAPASRFDTARGFLRAAGLRVGRSNVSSRAPAAERDRERPAKASDHQPPALAPATTDVDQSITEVGRTMCLFMPRSLGDRPRAS